MKDAVRDPAELCRLVGLPPQYHEAAQRAARDFTVFVPRRWIARMRYGDTRDPLLLQVLPLAEELNWPTEFTADPVGDRLAGRKPGLLSKYSGRVLLVTTGVCAVHCRYCFRRHFPYDEAPRGRGAWRPALDEIEQDPTLSEVILSGGDPLTLVDDVLAELVAGSGQNRSLAPPAHPHPTANHDPRARHRRSARLAARHAADAGRGRPRQPSGRAGR